MTEIALWGSVLCGVAGFCWLGVLALIPDDDRRRRAFGNLLWGIIFLYPGVFALYAGRSIYSGGGVDVPVASGIPALALVTAGVVATLALTVVMLELRRHEGGAATVVVAGTVFAIASQISAFAHRDYAIHLQSMFVVLLLVGFYFLNEDAAVVICRARLWLRGYVLCGLAVGILVPSWGLVLPDFGGRSWLPTRLIGFTSSTNYMALIAALALVLEMVKVNRSRHWRLYVAAALVACIWAQGRTGLAVAFFGVLAIALYSRSRSFETGLLAAMLASIAIGVVFQLTVEKQLAGGQRVALDAFATGRLEAWQYAWSSFLQDPLFGYGPNFFKDAYWVQIPVGAIRYANAHNQLLHSLGEAGILGATATVVLLAALFRGAFRRQDATQGASVAMLSSIVVQLPFGAPLALGGLTWNLIPFLLCVALTFQARSSTSSIRGPRCAARMDEWP